MRYTSYDWDTFFWKTKRPYCPKEAIWKNEKYNHLQGNKKVLLFQKWLQVDAGVDLGVLFS